MGQTVAALTQKKLGGLPWATCWLSKKRRLSMSSENTKVQACEANTVAVPIPEPPFARTIRAYDRSTTSSGQACSSVAGLTMSPQTSSVERPFSRSTASARKRFLSAQLPARR